MILVSEGKLIAEQEGHLTPLESGVLRKYRQSARDSAMRREWKSTGTGAKFTGVYDPTADADRAAETVNARVLDAARWQDNATLYTLMINGRSGIYQRPDDGGEEGIFLSDQEYRYRQLAPHGEDLLLTAEAAGECHLGLVRGGEESRICEFLTEGSCYESDPSWSRYREGVIHYASSGLEERLSDGEEHPQAFDETSLPDMMREMRRLASQARRRGPSEIFRMDLYEGTVEEILSDPRYHLTHPVEDADGSLYFIRAPYEAERKGSRLTVLKDVVLFPIRLIRALFGFFDFFTMKYSGKTLNNADGKAKDRSAQQRFVNGNLIDAEEELKRNRERGEDFPGYVPASHQLCRLRDGQIEVLKSGVCAYELCREGILISNGSYLLLLRHDGKEEKRLKADGVTRILL